VHDAPVVHVLDCLSDLLYDVGPFFLRQLCLLFQLLVERPSCHVLQSYVEVRFVLEKAVHGQDVAMSEAALDSQLESCLIDHHVRLDHGLGDLLEGEECRGIFVSDQINDTEFALAQFFPFFELLDIKGHLMKCFFALDSGRGGDDRHHGLFLQMFVGRFR
jgi:hypothetical protein